MAFDFALGLPSAFLRVAPLYRRSGREGPHRRVKKGGGASPSDSPAFLSLDEDTHEHSHPHTVGLEVTFPCVS